MKKPLLTIGVFLTPLVGPVCAQTEVPRTAPAESIALPSDAALPEWPKPTPFAPSRSAPAIRSKELELIHSDEGLGSFAVQVANKPMAIGQNRPMVGYVADGQLRWLDLCNAKSKKVSVRKSASDIETLLECTDADGGRWRVRQHFSSGPIPSSLDIQTEVTVDKDRSVAFLPMLMLFPGAGNFGTAKGQGLLAGCEYLDNEPSSSEADVVGPASKRQVPDNLKLTFPLMVIQNDGAYLALTWQMRPQFSAVFDSPDRLFGSNGHVMGLLFPGSDGKNRVEGNLLPHSCPLLRAGQTLSLRATLLGGLGKSIVPALQQYFALRRLPPLPAPVPDLQQYIGLAAGGWLDSKIREGNLIRHAVAGGHFNPGAAADAGLWMDWLAGHATDTNLAAQLKTTAKNVLSAVPPESLNFAGAGHIRFPVESLVYGHVSENAARAEQSARAALARFEPDGSVLYRPAEGGPDYAKTHSVMRRMGSPHARCWICWKMQPFVAAAICSMKLSNDYARWTNSTMVFLAVLRLGNVRCIRPIFSPQLKWSGLTPWVTS